MSEPEKHEGGAGGIEPTAQGSASEQANELVVQGLLDYLHGHSADARDRRVARALEAISAPPSADGGTRRAGSLVFRRMRWALSAAAALALVATITVVSLMIEPSAAAEVRRSIQAHRASEDRRYEIRVVGWSDEAPPAEPHAVVDTRAPDLLVVRHHPPRAERAFFVGRDARGTWAVREDRGIERQTPKRYWPPWSVDGESLLVDSIDRMLSQLETSYELERKDAAPIGDGSRLFDRISAVRTSREGPTPHSAEIWIDRATGLVERVEFGWESAEIVGDRPPLSERPRGSRPPPRDGERRAPPEKGRGERPRSPKKVIFERVEAPVLPADWFTPEGHVGAE